MQTNWVVRCAFAIAAVLAIVRVPVVHAQADDYVVHTEPITTLEIQYRIKFKELTTGTAPSWNEVLEELRDEKLKIIQARRLGLRISNAEVEHIYARMAKRMNMTPDQLTEALAKQGTNSYTLKQRIWADLARRRLGSAILD